MRCLIIGAGRNVEDHLAGVGREDFDAVLSVNKAALLYAPVDYHLSLHPEKWVKKKKGWFISFKEMDGVDEVFSYEWDGVGGGAFASGSSGLYAVKYALERMHAADVVLAGIGMDKAPHVYDNEDWKQAERFRDTWVSVKPRLTGRVTSLGGWTAKLLGKPQNL